MSHQVNNFDQPIGGSLPDWTVRARPGTEPMQGRLCRLEALDPAVHARPLHEAYSADADGREWTYLPYGPFASAAQYLAFLESFAGSEDPLFFAIVDLATSRPVGVAAYLRIDPRMGSIEVGHLRYSSALQRNPMATEAMYLMMRRVFDELGYRRYEWKCDSRNAPSLTAARRLGFQFEGVFRQAMVIKGRNRDTAWLSILDGEWPRLRAALENWLAPSNFDDNGRQRTRLQDIAAL